MTTETDTVRYIAAIVGQAATVHVATSYADGFTNTLCGSGRGKNHREVKGATVTCGKCVSYRIEL